MEPHGRVFWRTVVYTYSNYRDAERKAERVNGKWPALRAEVFTPKGRNRPPYMVALGGRMTREEAERLRKQARAKGLPRDTFVRNYAE
ncbi:MAG: SPOR domain-containing protein, partial [Acidobacteriia bacterium]|nr:SPOR domain-containing protein [Terriglobia bacterium]